MIRTVTTHAGYIIYVDRQPLGDARSNIHRISSSEEAACVTHKLRKIAKGTFGQRSVFESGEGWWAFDPARES